MTAAERDALIELAHGFLDGDRPLPFAGADGLWKQLKKAGELSLARQVLGRVRREIGLSEPLPPDPATRERLCQQHAMLTSKDVELGAGMRHDLALEILAEGFDLEAPELDGDAETLGIAGGIYKRRWSDLGQLEDLRRAARAYARPAPGPLGGDAYTQINAAFLEDLLAAAGDEPAERRERARALRERIVRELAVDPADWWNAASRAEAHLGLGDYRAAAEAIRVEARPEPWQLETTARQLAMLAHLRERRPLDNEELKAVFETLLPGAADAVRSVMVGKVGLAFSGGGFRASFYHLGVLARLAELDVLRHVSVLSCVSGGSIVGACYWLELRARLLAGRPLERGDYADLVRELIGHFERAVATDLRAHALGSRWKAAWRALRGRTLIDSARVADLLERDFYRPLVESGLGEPGEPLYLDQLPFTPADHDPGLTGDARFHPGKHNWLRAHKVPALVLNATTVNTGHAWQFTATWMGESPWAIHEAADSVPRLAWSWYVPADGWRIRLAEAVAASAGVPGLFSPLRLRGFYDGVDVQLVDGGVCDNQGCLSLLSLDCNVLLVSDAAGQLKLAKNPKPGLLGQATRSMDTLQERVRQVNFGDLDARRRTGLLRGLLFVHMKAGLDADPIRLPFAKERDELERPERSASGVRREFQEALANLRTDLDAFRLEESRALMACGYRMAERAYRRDLADVIPELAEAPEKEEWPFAEALTEITTTPLTDRQRKLLETLRGGA